jgi:uncharacterized short protein YbdD (DUF466 family)
MRGKMKVIWQTVRQLSGDDAYERYLRHYANQHQGQGDLPCHPPLSKDAFYKQWQDDKWNGVKRCC